MRRHRGKPQPWNNKAPLKALAAVLLVGALVVAVRQQTHNEWENESKSAEALRAGRYWSLVLAAFAHEDLMHVGFNALALSRAAPALQARLKHDRTTFWCFVFVAASRCAF